MVPAAHTKEFVDPSHCKDDSAAVLETNKLEKANADKIFKLRFFKALVFVAALRSALRCIFLLFFFFLFFFSFFRSGIN